MLLGLLGGAGIGLNGLMVEETSIYEMSIE
jgi:hypothetical protein